MRRSTAALEPSRIGKHDLDARRRLARESDVASVAADSGVVVAGGRIETRSAASFGPEIAVEEVVAVAAVEGVVAEAAVERVVSVVAVQLVVAPATLELVVAVLA